MALGVIEGYADQAKRGALDEDEAKARALATLSTMQANKGVDYFFVTDEVPTMLMHPTRPDLIGKPLDDVLSPDGKRIFPEFVRVAAAMSTTAGPRPARKIRCRRPRMRCCTNRGAG